MPSSPAHDERTCGRSMDDPIIAIDEKRCSGCGTCLAACKFQLLSFATRNWKKTTVVHDIERCTACGECARRCWLGAISVGDPRTRLRGVKEPIAAAEAAIRETEAPTLVAAPACGISRLSDEGSKRGPAGQEAGPPGLPMLAIR